MVNESQSDWDEKIDTVLMGYRASRQASTKHSPYFLLLHQQMRLPIDGEVLPSSCDEQEDEEEVDLDQKIQILLASREKAFKAVEANITAAQKCQKETYDRKHQPQVWGVAGFSFALVSQLRWFRVCVPTVPCYSSFCFVCNSGKTTGGMGSGATTNFRVGKAVH